MLFSVSWKSSDGKLDYALAGLGVGGAADFTDCAANCTPSRGPHAVRGARDEGQRWGDLTHRDRADALKIDPLAAITDRQAELLGDGWFSWRVHVVCVVWLVLFS